MYSFDCILTPSKDVIVEQKFHWTNILFLSSFLFLFNFLHPFLSPVIITHGDGLLLDSLLYCTNVLSYLKQKLCNILSQIHEEVVITTIRVLFVLFVRELWLWQMRNQFLMSRFGVFVDCRFGTTAAVVRRRCRIN